MQGHTVTRGEWNAQTENLILAGPIGAGSSRSAWRRRNMKSASYLAHRLRLAGAELPLFEPAAEEALFQATSGLPRRINLLAHHTLIAAALGQARHRRPVQAALPEVF